jgi:hypothetical protein
MKKNPHKKIRVSKAKIKRGIRPDLTLLTSSGGENCLAKYIKTKEQADSIMRQLEWLSKHPNERTTPW